VLPLRVKARRVVSAAETLALAVLVNCPHAINSLVDVAIGTEAGEHSRRNQPKEHILRFELEEGRPQSESCNFVETEGCCCHGVAGEIGRSADLLDFFGCVGSELLVCILFTQNLELLIN